MVKNAFGDELLFALYNFYETFHSKPDNWLEVFEYARFVQAKNALQEMAMNAAKAGKK